MTTCLVGLGSNLGDRAALIERAIEFLREHAQVGNLVASGRYPTAPIGGPPGQTEFLNAAVRFDTSLAPEEMLALLHDIEAQLGRQRDLRWQARTIDLDLLLFGERVIQTPELTVPHPRMAFRRFVLLPAAEVAGEMVHPLIGWSVAHLLRYVQTAYRYVAITGVAQTGKSALAQWLSEAKGMIMIADPVRRGEQDESECAGLRRAALRSIDTDHKAGAVSDFWLSQSLAYNRHGLSQIDLITLEAQQFIVPPKLLVLLDQGDFGPERHVATNLRWLLTRPDQGPFLVLDASRPELAREELLAAVEAMDYALLR